MCRKGVGVAASGVIGPSERTGHDDESNGCAIPDDYGGDHVSRSRLARRSAVGPRRHPRRHGRGAPRRPGRRRGPDAQTRPGPELRRRHVGVPGRADRSGGPEPRGPGSRRRTVGSACRGPGDVRGGRSGRRTRRPSSLVTLDATAAAPTSASAPPSSSLRSATPPLPSPSTTARSATIAGADRST